MRRIMVYNTEHYDSVKQGYKDVNSLHELFVFAQKYDAQVLKLEDFIARFNDDEGFSIDHYATIFYLKKSTRNEIMNFMRSDDWVETLTNEDRMEIFMQMPVGSEDLTVDLFNELLSDYDSPLRVQPLAEDKVDDNEETSKSIVEVGK